MEPDEGTNVQVILTFFKNKGDSVSNFNKTKSFYLYLQRFNIVYDIVFLLDFESVKYYGEWTEWSDCSKTCIDNYEMLPHKRRTRTCHPYCDRVYAVEEQACIELPKCIQGGAIICAV